MRTYVYVQKTQFSLLLLDNPERFLRFVYKLMRTVFEVDVTVLDDLGAFLLNSCPWLPVNFRIDCRDISWFTKLSEVWHHNIFLTL